MALPNFGACLQLSSFLTVISFSFILIHAYFIFLQLFHYSILITNHSYSLFASKAMFCAFLYPYKYCFFLPSHFFSLVNFNNMPLHSRYITATGHWIVHFSDGHSLDYCIPILVFRHRYCLVPGLSLMRLADLTFVVYKLIIVPFDMEHVNLVL